MDISYLVYGFLNNNYLSPNQFVDSKVKVYVRNLFYEVEYDGMVIATFRHASQLINYIKENYIEEDK